MAYGWPKQKENWCRYPNKYSPHRKVIMKKFGHRKMRRFAKKDPENAPKKMRYHGWEY